MNYLSSSLFQAFHLLINGDTNTYSAIFVSLKASTCSIILSLLIGIPLGFKLGMRHFYGHRIIKIIVNTFLALPTVVIGLFVYTLICHQGMFGKLNLLFSVKAIIIGQTILGLPIVIALTSNAIENIDERLHHMLLTLGANKRQAARTILYESRYVIFVATAVAYGRIISELGISIMLGGNIKWYTRTITTAIALQTSKGEFSLGLALGLILLLIALSVNILAALCREKIKIS